ncbi:MAG TPA: M13 family metallopeptidase [Rhizomicrobium sp.]|jgi:predicted metalloendopeptidase|nr:M13 family metallopeptidase [Rhizomicrobium sp.]
MRKIALLALCMNLATAGGAALAAGTSAPGIDLAGIDHSVKPGDDFFSYANGAWLKGAEIPGDRSSYGVGAILSEKVNGENRAIMESAASGNAAAGTDARKIGDFYASYMDEAGIDAKGIAPLKDAAARIATISDKRALATEFGSELRADVDPINNTNFYTDHLFGLWVNQGLEDTSRYYPYLLQGGLGMPDREYYLAADARMAAIREKYQAHVAAVLKLAGVADAEAKAAKIVALEIKIATAHVSRTDSEDVLKANNPWKREEFAKRAPGLDWDAFFAAAQLNSQPTFVVWQPAGITGISKLVASEPLDVWKDYLTFHLYDHYAPVLPKAFVDENFAFYGTVLSGTPKMRDRWKRAVDATNNALGMAVGRIYVQKYFPPSSKAQIQAMVGELKAAFARRIDALTWMAPETKVKAKAKLTTLIVGVGYPDKWIDYSTLDIVRGDAVGNTERAEAFEYRRNLAKFGHPVDRGEWVMNPQLVNAVNLPLYNALNFPAAILQPPFFDPKADAAVNFGSIGATIGHEISHSFDDQGSQFDASGKLQNWWTPSDAAHFKATADRLAAQFDGYHPFPDAHVNGKQTLSENIADVAGLYVAHDAYVMSLGGKPAPAAQGLTGDQQFFLAFAQSWRQKAREAALRRQLLTDGHAPAQYRADTVRNLDAWYPAFGVKAGETLYLAPDQRVKVW